MTRKFGYTLVIAAAIVSAAMVRAEDVATQLSTYMDAAVKVEQFSGTVLVAKGGEVIFQKGYGQANIEHGIANTPETKFRLGSITKQFTATAILILQDRGKLNVEDPISKHLDDAPSAWEPVKIHHLLTHTSGIPSYTDDIVYRLAMHKPETTSSMVARFKEKALEFEPGSQFKYSNSGYFLLGVIIEKASGESYETFLRQAIFEPLGMNDTGYDRQGSILPHRASGYERRGDDVINAPYLDMSQPFSAGALYSTVGDLVLWDRGLKEGALLSKESMAAMFKPEKNGYAYGWSIGEVAGHKLVGHGGGINGFATDFVRFPEDDLCVAVLSNVVPSSPAKFSRALARIAFGESVPPPKARAVAKIDPKIYDEYVGSYELTPGFVLTVTREGDRLMTQATGQPKIEVYPESETEFFLKVVDAQLTFVKEKDRVTHVMLHQNGASRKAVRVDDSKAPKEN